MFVISVNYKWASVPVRERVSLPPDEALALMARLREAGIEECVLLSTCGRTELYGSGDAARAAELFAGDAEEIRDRMLFCEGERAARHLFRVASGLESMAVGEDEILGQVKKAFVLSAEHGFTGHALNAVFRAAITSAKRVKTETLLSKSSVSVATLAAARCEHFVPGRKTAVVVGCTGEIGGKTLLGLLSYDDFDLYVTSRGARTDLPERVKVVDFEDRYLYINKADVVVSATRSPGCTVEADRVLPDRPRLYVDLAVPRDIDPGVASQPGAELVTVDDLEALAKRNNERKRGEIARAEAILEEDLGELRKELAFRRILPQVGEGRTALEFLRGFRDAATPEEFGVFAGVLARMDGAL